MLMVEATLAFVVLCQHLQSKWLFDARNTMSRLLRGAYRTLDASCHAVTCVRSVNVGVTSKPASVQL